MQRMFVDRTITCWKYMETLQPNNKPCFVIYERYLRTSDTAHIPSGHVSYGFGIHRSIASTFCQSPEIQLSSTHCHAVRCTSMNRRNTLSKKEIFTTCHTKNHRVRDLNWIVSVCFIIIFYLTNSMYQRMHPEPVSFQFYGYFNSPSLYQCYVLRIFKATLPL